jgi:hypothetical protein
VSAAEEPPLETPTETRFIAPPIEPPGAQPLEPPIDTATAPAIDIPSTRRLLTTAFDLLSRSNEDLRRASFYIGVIVLGTVGPVALATWALGVSAVERSPTEIEAVLAGSGGAVVGLLGILAVIGLVVAAVESRNIAIAVLGGRIAGRSVTPRQALARSRQVFWSAMVGAVIVAIPIGVAEAIASSVIADGFQTIPGFSPGKSGDSGRPKPKRWTYAPRRAGPSLIAILMAPTLLDLATTSSKVRTL